MSTLYKGKGHAVECGSYRGIRLLEHCDEDLGEGC